jgi:hypothetical protein
MNYQNFTWPDGNISEYYYYTTGKKQQEISYSPDGSRVVYAYNYQEQVTTQTFYDANGNRQGVRTYDYLGDRVSKETYYYPEGGYTETYYNNAKQPHRECVYDKSGNLTNEIVRTYYSSGFTQTSKEYDADRNCTIITYYENGPFQERLEYTADGSLTEKQCNQPDLSGYIEEYYENGLVKTLFVYGPNYDHTEETQYTYRDDGTLKTAKVIDKKTWAYEIIEYAEDGKTQVKVTKYDANDNVIG